MSDFDVALDLRWYILHNTAYIGRIRYSKKLFEKHQKARYNLVPF